MASLVAGGVVGAAFGQHLRSCMKLALSDPGGCGKTTLAKCFVMVRKSKMVEGCGGFHWPSKWLAGNFVANLKRNLDLKGEEFILNERFMDIGSFPEDQRTPVAALIDMWLELHELDEGGIHAIANLHELAIRNLAKLIDTRKDASEICSCYREVFVGHLLQ